MRRATSLGGIFFKCENPEKIKEWYKNHLGLQTDDYGTSFEWRQTENPDKKGFTIWSPFSDNSDYFEPSEKDFMINLRVENLEELVEMLIGEGIPILGEIKTYPYGKFAHILDPEGNKIELWE